MIFLFLKKTIIEKFENKPITFLHIPKNGGTYIKSYFTHRKQLVWAFVLIDIRHDPLKIDIEFMEWLTRTQNAFNIIFTKCDKINLNVFKI